jgi:hypothetical protein
MFIQGLMNIHNFFPSLIRTGQRLGHDKINLSFLIEWGKWAKIYHITFHLTAKLKLWCLTSINTWQQLDLCLNPIWGLLQNFTLNTQIYHLKNKCRISMYYCSSLVKGICKYIIPVTDNVVAISTKNFCIQITLMEMQSIFWIRK